MLLLSESELGNDGTVALDILLHQVVEEVLSLTNHLEKTATAVVVVGVLLQMLGEVSNSLGENSDLYLGRTGISFVCSVVNDDLLLYFFFPAWCSPHKNIFRTAQQTAGDIHP